MKLAVFDGTHGFAFCGNPRVTVFPRIFAITRGFGLLFTVLGFILPKNENSRFL